MTYSTQSSGWRFHTRYEVHNDEFVLHIVYIDEQGKLHILKPFEFEPRGTPVPPVLGSAMHGTVHEGTPMSVRNFLQGALDAAWEFGLRPKDFKDHKDELTAVRDHLADMRKLAKVPGA